jgi:outer membrane protein assembly factor BamA
MSAHTVSHSRLTCILGLCLATTPLLAAEYGVDEDTVVVRPEDAGDKRFDIVLTPIPIANPTIGNGLAVAGLILYKFDSESPASSTAIAAGYTDSDSWGVGALQEANFSEDRWRLTGGLALALARYDLYAPEGSDFHFTTEQRVAGGMLQVLRQVTSRLYAGLRYQRARVTFPTPEELQAVIPAEGLDLDIGGLGIVAEWDSRDHGYQPGTGSYLTLRGNFARDEFGGDLEYDTYGLALNHFRGGFRDKDVLALRLSVCGTTDDTPFFERCQFGSSNDLRGYPVGRYYDDAMYAAQVEYRAPLWKRVGGVVFAGVGSVASSFADLDAGRTLSAAGIGLRFLASPEQRVNVSIDWAVGRDESALYVYIGEAF